MKTLQTVPDELMPIVASAGSPTYFEPTMDVSAAPVNVPAKRLQAAIAEQRFPVARSMRFDSLASWESVAEFLDQQTAGVSFEANSSNHYSLCAGDDYAILAVELDRRWDEWTVTVAAVDRPTATKWLDAMAALLPDIPPPPPSEPLPYDIIPVRFWMQNPRTGEATSRHRNIKVHSWGDVETNYSAACRTQLDALMKSPNPSGGKLVLMHGEPGTGKTNAILSLMSEWREWCTASVVTDADKFFGDPTYCNSLTFNMEGARDWLLLVLEDADEFINVKGRETKGQSISRLLNLADGIVGRGLNLLVLMTTNVAVDELNPAITRNGRCMANVHVGAFEPAEATAWLAERGRDGVTFEAPVMLADLYATLNAQ